MTENPLAFRRVRRGFDPVQVATHVGELTRQVERANQDAVEMARVAESLKAEKRRLEAEGTVSLPWARRTCGADVRRGGGRGCRYTRGERYGERSGESQGGEVGGCPPGGRQTGRRPDTERGRARAARVRLEEAEAHLEAQRARPAAPASRQTRRHAFSVSSWWKKFPAM